MQDVRTSRAPLLYQLVGQQADAYEVHALREDEQSVMVFHNKPQQQEGLQGWVRGCMSGLREQISAIQATIAPQNNQAGSRSHQHSGHDAQV